MNFIYNNYINYTVYPIQSQSCLPDQCKKGTTLIIIHCTCRSMKYGTMKS